MTITTSTRSHEDQQTTRQVWTPATIRALGATTGIETAGAIIGIGRTKAYALARTGTFPVRVIPIGRRYIVPVADLLAFLGMEQ